MKSSHLLRIWQLTKKNVTLYIKKGPVIIFGFLFPIFLMFSWIIGRTIEPEVILIGIGSMTIFFTATSISPVVLPIETKEHSLERQLVSPIHIFDIILGIVLASAIFSLVITSIILIGIAIGLSITAIGIVDILVLFLSLVLIAFASSLLGVLISAVPTDATSEIMVLVNLVKFPIIFISGIFSPLHNAAKLAIFVGYCSPLTPFVDIFYGVLLQRAVFPLWGNLLLLVGWVAVLICLNVIVHPRTMPKRFSLGTTGPKRKKRG